MYVIKKLSLLYEVLDFKNTLKAIRSRKDIYLKASDVFELFGPLTFFWEIGHDRVMIILTTEELLVLSSNEDALDQAKIYFAFTLGDYVELIDESYSIFSTAKRGRTQSNGFEDLINNLQWPRPDDKVVVELLCAKMGRSHSNHLHNAVKLWYDFCNKVQPNYRKPATWAAAVEFAVKKMNKVEATKTELQVKYDVSYSTILQKYKELKNVLALVVGDYRYTTER